MLMIDQLIADPKKVLQPARNDMMRMLQQNFNLLGIDVANCFRALWVANTLDRS